LSGEGLRRPPSQKVHPLAMEGNCLNETVFRASGKVAANVGIDAVA
jgi:hypothetical protein